MDNRSLQKLSSRSVGAIGTALFLTFFALTYSVPGWVENYAADYIESRALERLDASIDAARPSGSGSALAQLAQSVIDKNEVRIEQLKSNLKDNVHAQWASALAEVRDLDCECRQKWQDRFEEGFLADIGLLQAANEQVTSFIHASYMDVATELKRDIRVFAASNATVFALLLLVSFLRPAAAAHLFLPAILLAVAALICSYFYIFEQDWLLTVIQGNYLGFAYLAWLGIVFLLLCDIVVNRARITTRILNAIFHAFGSAMSVAPC